VRIGIGLFGLQQWFDGDLSGVLEVVRLADSKGVDLVSLTDHILSKNIWLIIPTVSFQSGWTFPGTIR
jgi:hypothetical protein